MNHEMMLTIQALVDGELSRPEEEALRREMDKLPECGAYHRRLLKEVERMGEISELEHGMPFQASFLAQRVMQRIHSLEDPASVGRQDGGFMTRLQFLWRTVLPISLGCLIALWWFQPANDSKLVPDTISSESIKSGTSAMGYYESKDSSMPPRGVISFRSESERVSVMWISND